MTTVTKIFELNDIMPATIVKVSWDINNFDDLGIVLAEGSTSYVGRIRTDSTNLPPYGLVVADETVLYGGHKVLYVNGTIVNHELAWIAPYTAANGNHAYIDVNMSAWSELKRTVFYINNYLNGHFSWSYNLCSVNFIENSGTAVTNLVDVYKLPTVLPTPTRVNYTFAGWYYDAEFTSQANINDVVIADTTLYAKWIYAGASPRPVHTQIQPTLIEKRYATIQFLEAAYMSGNHVNISQVDTYSLTALSGEQFTYKAPINSYIIYDERPKVSILKTYGWYREDDENLPQLAYVPTHLLYDKTTGEVINDLVITGSEYHTLTSTGESEHYILRPLKIIRGTLIDVFFDFMPDAINRFYVVDVRLDTVSINYVCRLMPYKYVAPNEGEEGQNPSNNVHLNFDSNAHGL
jgi:uncharacterized repeat protein (TIGR02543 family)